MHSATPIASAPPSGLVRRLVLGSAVALGLALALAPHPPGVHAQDARPVSPPADPKNPSLNATVKDGDGGTATLDIQVDKGKKSVTINKTVTTKPGAGITIDEDDEPSAPIPGSGPGKRGKGVRVGVFGDDRQYESFNDFVHSEPGLAFMVVSIVALVFLSPVLAIGLILWYRMRKARMLNETMLRLAEKGVVPPAEALSALAGGAPSAITAVPSAAPLYEQAKQIQRRAAWSDLRKGVLVGGFGLGLAFYSMLDDGTPNALGLVLLFVGIGYIVLWWFEDRQATLRGNGAGASPPPPPSGGTGGVT